MERYVGREATEWARRQALAKVDAEFAGVGDVATRQQSTGQEVELFYRDAEEDNRFLSRRSLSSLPPINEVFSYKVRFDEWANFFRFELRVGREGRGEWQREDRVLQLAFDKVEAELATFLAERERGEVRTASVLLAEYTRRFEDWRSAFSCLKGDDDNARRDRAFEHTEAEFFGEQRQQAASVDISEYESRLCEWRDFLNSRVLRPRRRDAPPQVPVWVDQRALGFVEAEFFGARAALPKVNIAKFESRSSRTNFTLTGMPEQVVREMELARTGNALGRGADKAADGNPNP
eukprot:g9582.t1